MRRFPLALLALPLFAASNGPEPWPLERLFTRPFSWGTPASDLVWSKDGHTLAFLWNADGRRFLDLYAYHPDSRKLVRLTDLEGVHDDINLTEAEKDERLKQYELPGAGLAGFDLSRDGSRAAFTYQGDLYIVPTDASAPPFRLTKTKLPESSPQFSPDGKKLAYLRGGQLFTQDLTNGQLLQPADADGIASYKWSPDGKRILYSIRSGAGRQITLTNYSGRFAAAHSFPRSVAGDEPSQSRLFTVPAEGGKPVAMDSSPWGPRVWSQAQPQWSPDGAHIAQIVIHPDLKREQVLVLDALTGKAKSLHEWKDAAWVNEGALGWSPDGKTVFFTSDESGFQHLYTVPVSGGEARQVTRGNWEIHREQAIYAQDPQWVGDHLYYTSTEVATSERHFYRIKPDGTGKERLSEREGINVGLVSSDGKSRAILQADLKHPLDLWVDGAQVTHRERTDFAAYAWPETRFYTFASKDDHQTVAGKMLLPPGYRVDDKRRKWPAVFFIHGSGYATSILKQWGSYQEFRYVFNSYLANKGYVVFDIDYRGSSGYGRDWRTGVYLNMGGPDLEDVLGAVDYARSLGNVDMQRLGIWGVSYGGFMTDMAMFRAPDVFRAGAAFAAVTDWENYNAFYTDQRLTRPQDNPEAYRRSSPITYAGNLKNPLLVVHGMVDDNVLFQDDVQLSEKLIHEGRQFWQAFYPEESHGFLRDETLIDSFRRTAEFFDQHLGVGAK